MRPAAERSDRLPGAEPSPRDLSWNSDQSPRIVPLSFPQRRLWFLHRLEPDNPRYNMASVLRLTGQLELDALQQAVNRLVARHETLRTWFAAEAGEPVQIVDPDAQVDIAVKNLAGLPQPERDAARSLAIRQEVNRPFDLSAKPLLRCTLLQLAPEDHVLVVTMHHIISDEWSFGVLQSELAQIYTSARQRVEPTLPELPIQYSDYAEWQNEWDATFSTQLAFWRDQLNGNPAGVELPTDQPRRAERTSRGAARWQNLGLELSRRVFALARSQRATPLTLLLAAFKALLYRYTRQEDIIVGLPVAGRNRVETEGLIGFFVNTLALRTRLAGSMPFQDLLTRVRETALAAYSHQDLPFDRIVEALQPERALDRTPFINVMFLMEYPHQTANTWSGLEAEPLDPELAWAKFDLTLILRQDGEELIAAAQYDSDLFAADTIDRLLEHYVNLLAGIVDDPHCPICELPILGRAERHRLLVEWNRTQTEYPRNACVHQLFEEQAQRRPGAVAVQCGNSSLSYKALNQQANRLAHRLQRLGVTPGTPVGLCCRRSLEMLVGVLGILKSGAAYAPLDPTLPSERLAGMLADLKPSALVCSHPDLVEVLPEIPEVPTLCLENDRQLDRESTADPNLKSAADQIAYISFTSGSTGQPKGVCVPHRAIVRLVRNTNYLQVDPADVFLQLAPLAFDASTFEIWGSLLNGARLAIMPPHVPSLSELAGAIERFGVTTAWFTSGLFNQIVDQTPAALKRLRRVFTGGDVLSPAHVRKALSWLPPGGTLTNGYGPTENATFTACHSVPSNFDGQRPVPIGKPISNTTCYVLDEARQLVPAGVPGELYAGGVGLASGYLNDPTLTAEKFVPDPFHPGQRLYRTGDLVRWTAEGTLEFIGRNNDQVKVRGFRVELGEIEHALLTHPALQQCAVVARRDATGGAQLVAYVVPKEGGAPNGRDMRNYLAERLPEYAVPDFVVTLERLPLSRNGKVDRAALPAPESQQPSDGAAGPRDELESQLQALWQEVLKVSPIGIHDRFFALGGHSLLAIRLLALVEKKLGKALKVAAVFQHPTIAGMAALLRGNARPGDSSVVEVQPAGSRPPLFLVHGAGGGMFWGYANLSRHLGRDQPVFAFRSRGLNGEEELDTIEELAKVYIGDLRAYQPRGPYRLGGYCFGGVVAYEMARQLEAQGENVAFLGLINTNAPNSSYTQFRWTPASVPKFALNLLRRAYFLFRAHPERLRNFLLWKLKSLVARPRRSSGDPDASHHQADVNPEEWVDFAEFPEIERRMWHKHLNALGNYRPQPYRGRVWLFRSPVHLLRCSFEPHYGWRPLVLGGLQLEVIPFAHEAVMEEPGVRSLANAIEACLNGPKNSPKD